ncbi:helix-turn-helix domain-containing protein [Lichenibacterium dinghuense]|uniref:helix-turn-helix domain-containing protein n=1 Tax=Lichenibacterium dinghuense TaxID=2895977 RepID=UPI001F19A55E|nr:helix-turn-helix domain-containing protein [Lichenibacterium sp. 6Y81]
MSDKPEQAWFDIHGAKSYSALSRSSIYNKLKAGELEGRKLGKRLVISRASIDRMMASLPKFGQAA